MTNRSLHFLSIGPGHRARIGYIAIAIGVAWGFIYLFVQLSSEWQIALGAVALLAGYLLFNGYRAHRTADQLEHPTD